MGSRLRDGLADLRRTYLERLDPAMDEILQDWARLRGGGGVEAATRLQRGVHRLAGSGATFGFRSLSDRAAVLEDRLDQALGSGSELDGTTIEDIEQDLERLKATVLRIEKGRPRRRTSGRAAEPGSRA